MEKIPKCLCSTKQNARKSDSTKAKDIADRQLAYYMVVELIARCMMNTTLTFETAAVLAFVTFTAVRGLLTSGTSHTQAVASSL